MYLVLISILDGSRCSSVNKFLRFGISMVTVFHTLIFVLLNTGLFYFIFQLQDFNLAEKIWRLQPFDFI